MKKHFWNHVRILLLTTTLIFATLFTCHFGFAQTLTLAVSTSRPSYIRGETVAMNGTLTVDGMPVADGVVGIEVDKPDYDPLVVRTCTTGSTVGDWSVEVLQVYPSDSNGYPKSSFNRGTLAYYTTVVRNNENIDKNVTIALNLYYSGVIPLKVNIPLQGVIGPGNHTIIVSDPIPFDAASGTYTVYANVFSELPVFNGYAYSPEKSANFTVTSTLTSSLEDVNPGTIETASIDGSYSLYFGLSATATLGNYTVYASSYYQGQLATAYVTFGVNIIGDVNYDGRVDGKDIAVAAKAFGTRPGDLLWDVRADVSNDGKIDGKDIAIIAKNFGQIAQSVTTLHSLASLKTIQNTFVTPYSSAPVAAFAYPPEVLVGQLVTFDASASYDPDGTIVSYFWNFGDQSNTTLADPIATHAYTAMGTYNVSLAVTDNEGDTGSLSQPIVVLFGRLIDAFVGSDGVAYPGPYGGQGQDRVADVFEPQKTVSAYALVTYNGDAVQSKLVSFIVISPSGLHDLSRTAITNETGYAYIEFGLPWPCDDPVNEIFGIWNITVNVDIRDEVVEDTVAFKVWWLAEITAVVPKAAEVVKGGVVIFDFYFRTYRMQPIDAVEVITLYDDLAVPIGSLQIISQSIGWGNYTWCRFKEYKLTLQITIPEWAFVGTGTVYANIFHFDPANPYYIGSRMCPEKQAVFSILKAP